MEYGSPEQVLTDNGRQFTGKFSRPRPSEVLFDRICRKNGIEHLLTKVRSPTTTGKVERWHQTSQREYLGGHGPFQSVEAAQAALDAWRIEYNEQRPHQALDMSTPASRFRPASIEDRELMPLWLPAELRALPGASSDSSSGGGLAEAGYDDPHRRQGRSSPTPEPGAGGGSTLTPATDRRSDTASRPPGKQRRQEQPGTNAVELERVVPVSGNLTVGPQQVWLGPQRAGQSVSFWIDTTTVHLSLDGTRLKTLPSRLSVSDLARLRANGARPAGPPPAAPSAAALAGGAAVEVDRVVNGCGLIALAGVQVNVGLPLAGQRVVLRLEEQLLHVIADGLLWRTIPLPIPVQARERIRGAKLAGPPPRPPDGPARVQRRVSERGSIQVCRQRVQVGLPHAGQTVTVDVEETRFRVLDQNETMLTVVPRTNTREVTRHKAYGHTSRRA